MPKPSQASVDHVCSFNRNVYLKLKSGEKGWVDLTNNPAAFAIAAAAEFANRTLYVVAWKHDPKAAKGAGQFGGAYFAPNWDGTDSYFPEPPK